MWNISSDISVQNMDVYDPTIGLIIGRKLYISMNEKQSNTKYNPITKLSRYTELTYIHI